MSVFKGQHFLDFDQPPAAPCAPSREAAASQTPAKRGGDKARILEVLAAGPMTDEEIAAAAGLLDNTVRPRRGELVRDGLVVAVDELGRTRAGKRATRWGVKTT